MTKHRQQRAKVRTKGRAQIWNEVCFSQLQFHFLSSLCFLVVHWISLRGLFWIISSRIFSLETVIEPSLVSSGGRFTWFLVILALVSVHLKMGLLAFLSSWGGAADFSLPRWAVECSLQLPGISGQASWFDGAGGYAQPLGGSRDLLLCPAVALE